MKVLKRKSLAVVFLCLAGLLLNMGMSYAAVSANSPLYFDTTGTVLAAALGGYVPGVVVGLLTNIIKNLYEANSIYYCLVNVVIAVITAYCFHTKKIKKALPIAIYVLVISTIGGFVSAVISWYIYGYSGDTNVGEYIKEVHDGLHFSKVAAQVLTYFVFDFIDKVLTIVFVLIIIALIPQKVKNDFSFAGWKQTPDTALEIVNGERIKCRVASLQTKIIAVLTFASVSIAIVATAISLMLFRGFSRDQHIKLARGITDFTVDIIDPEIIDDYMSRGESMPEYLEIERMLYEMRDATPDVEYVYVYKIEEDGCHVVFDLDTEEVEGGAPGELIPFDKSFDPLIADLLAGKEVEPIITDDTYGWLLTVYTPIYNEAGDCVCYACCDVSMTDISYYELDFIIKLLLLFLGFFAVILIIALWLARYHVIIPINSMAYSANAFAYDSEAARHYNVERIRNLNIRTGDEVENLYNAFSKTTEDSVSYFDEAQSKTEAISRMQSGLILVLADMVENRDSSTGDHVRKTAAYVKIILEKMKEQGKYTDIITEQYINDVVDAAPLHDVGKIAISDAILNKPGRLTEEEFEIMKTHTTSGMRIIDQVMETLPDAEYLKEARNVTAYHHEKWNGKGYPFGLSGENIPLSARVMAVADVFDALVSERIYKPPFKFEEAVEIIRKDTGTHFDPAVTEAFLARLDDVREVAEKFGEVKAKYFKF